MKQMISFSFMVFLLSSMSVKTKELSIGDKAPLAQKKLQNFDGKDYTLLDSKLNNGLLVVFSSNSCPWVIKNQAVASDAFNYAIKKGIGVIVVNSNEGNRDDENSPAAMKNYALQQNYNWPYVIDKNSVLADAFGAKVTPECYLFDANLNLVYHGAITDNPKTPSESTREHLKIAMNELVDGKTVSINKSRALGCTIKRR